MLPDLPCLDAEAASRQADQQRQSFLPCSRGADQHCIAWIQGDSVSRLSTPAGQNKTLHCYRRASANQLCLHTAIAITVSLSESVKEAFNVRGPTIVTVESVETAGELLAEEGTFGTKAGSSVLLTERPASRAAAGWRPGCAGAESTDMDAGELGSEGPMSIRMLCIDTWTQKTRSACIA